MRLVIAGGGTGGHLFPGVALAAEFTRRAGDVEVVFIGARHGLESRVIPALGYELVTLPVRGVVGGGFFRGMTRAMALLWAALRAYLVLGRLKPDLVVGVGGYASVPAVMAAAARGIPRSILEQNVMPGKANRVLAHMVQRIYQGFASRTEVFPVEKTVVTGNPIREEVLPPAGMVRPAGRRNLLILGGSQGARQVNGLALGFVPRLLADFPGMKVIHQTGPAHEEIVRQGYREAGAEVEIVPFITEMADAYARADLCLSRAGAMSISELAAAGLPALLIPYPDAAGGHQEANARWFEERGGAIVASPEEATSELVYKKLARLMGTTGRLEEMADASRRAGTRDAAKRIVEEELGRIGFPGRGGAGTER
ncbi:MAG: undecaprenyldiphospho-muramoylpentapeptide beta-N-acetylglucosaminyltransferase [bacterium]|nr:undecaprenyldiphospho-muramoylpentapeptide beta-N-acetylglucosaminyltransferase [bacterium]MDT8395282.1 undecaprenyldiphospho-muramoylpentapeptide beta-N-acetylglucosaminyltransferase [bacterium]